MKIIMTQVFIVILGMLTIQCSDEADGSVTLGQTCFTGRISLTGGSVGDERDPWNGRTLFRGSFSG